MEARRSWNLEVGWISTLKAARSLTVSVLVIPNGVWWLSLVPCSLQWRPGVPGCPWRFLMTYDGTWWSLVVECGHWWSQVVSTAPGGA